MNNTTEMQTGLKLNKDKCCFRCTSVPFYGEVRSRHGMKPYPQKLKALTGCLLIKPKKKKKELLAFLGKINYLNKFSPSIVHVCKSIRQLTSSKTE